MRWIEAALAFSLIMFVLATIVTLVMESAYKVLLTREKSFRLMMARLFDEVLKPRVGHLLRGVTIGQARERFLDTVTRNQAYEDKNNVVRERVQSDQLASMTMMQFADRLADTDVGKAIARGGSEYVDNAINDLAMKFDRFGAASTQRFQDHARFWCMSLSLVLAFVANIDAIQLAKSLVADKSLTSKIIEKYGGAVDESAQRPVDIVQRLAELTALKNNGGLTEPEFENFKKALQEAQGSIGELRDTGLAITTDVFPFCRRWKDVAASTDANGPQPAKRVYEDERCSQVQAGKPGTEEGVGALWIRFTSLAGLSWFFSVILAGAMIGLGAPFWFDLARGLARTARALGVLKQETASDKPAPVVVVGATAPPTTPVDAFKVAINAARPARARILLSTTGRPVGRTGS